MTVSMKTPTRRSRTWALRLWPLLLLAGCRDAERPLRLADLTPAEETYVSRFVTLERARAVALADPAAGGALLDSLAAAWGDSATVDAVAALPEDADRLEKLHVLLSRILETEADSLLAAPETRRLEAPLPPPAPLPSDALDRT